MSLSATSLLPPRLLHAAKRPARSLPRYAIAILSFLIAACISRLLARFGQISFYLPLLAAALFSAWYGSIGAALVCQICGALFAFNEFLWPVPFAASRKANLYGLLLFLLVGKLALALTATLRSMCGMRRTEENLRLIAMATNDSIWEWDFARDRMWRSNNLLGIFGYPQDKMESDSSWWRERLHPEEADRVWNGLNDAIAEGATSWTAEYRVRNENGSYTLVVDRGTVVRNSIGKALRMIGGMSDITAHRRAEERLAHNALYDTLTELANRQLFRNRLEQAMRRNTGDSQKHVAVLFLDLDRFKVVNDSLGHPVGDKLLRALSKRIELSLRPGESAARFGGDEFTVLIEAAESLADAVAVAQRVLESFAAPYELDGHSFVVTASVGIAVADRQLTPEELLRRADIAMYRAKSHGRARYEVFEPARDTRSMNILQLESELRKSYADGDFRLYYQPIVNLTTNRIFAFEALLRWQHPRRGLLLPAEFLSLAEESSLITDLGHWVLKTASAQVRQWRNAIGEAQDLLMTVNLAGRQFAEQSLVESVRNALQENDLAGQALILELTENMILESDAVAMERLHQLRSLGVLLAIDDFGKGRSSLGRLQDVPISILKIDGSFVRRIREGKPEIVDAMIALALKLKLDIIAECVETDTQFQHLKRSRCTGAQGLFFAGALTPNAAERLLKSGVSSGLLSKASNAT